MTPRLAFLGLGWIGRHRLQSLVDERACEVVVLADSSEEARRASQAIVPTAATAATLDELLAYDLDGVVIATPSALHAEQALRVLERKLAVFCQKPLARTAHETRAIVEAARRADRLLGCDLSYRHTEAMRRIRKLAVFCQKPLARTAQETRAIVEAARRADRLLGCDLSYRHTEAMRRIRNAVVEGELGPIYAVDLLFHNAYGPNQGWARDMALAGGGCAIDLGTHLVDLALWVLGFPQVQLVTSRLFSQGRALAPGEDVVEDYAVAQLELDGGAVARLACSWNLPMGRDAVIEAHFHGARGGASLRNRDGSFYDFVAERYQGTQRFPLADPPDAWGGRAVLDWVRRLAGGARYDSGIESVVQVATALDAIYGR